MASLFQPAPEPPTELGRLRILSKTAGVRVSPLQLGGMSIGDAWKEGMGSMDQKTAHALLDAFVAAGGNFIDTANNYQDEQSEEIIGAWAAQRGIRDQLVIATKFTIAYQGHKVSKGTALANYAGNSKKSLHISLRASLKKLQTDYVDILYVHYWDWTTSIPELMHSLHHEVQAGRVLYLGISDTPAWVVAAANTYATANGLTPFSIYQGRWNIMLRDMQREIIPMCHHFGMAIAPWDAIGGGKFQTKKQLEERKKNGEGLRKMLGNGEQTENEVKISEALEKVASEHGVNSPTAVALAYVMSKAVNVFPIVGGRKVEHLHDNIQALKIKLTDKQIEYLESIVPFQEEFPNNFIGPDIHVSGVPGPLTAGVAPLAIVRDGKPIGHE